MSLWCNRKGAINVQELNKDMTSWQQQCYLDRKIWEIKLFTANALFFQKSCSEGNEYGTISYEESRIFEDRGLDKKKCFLQYANTSTLRT